MTRHLPIPPFHPKDYRSVRCASQWRFRALRRGAKRKGGEPEFSPWTAPTSPASDSPRESGWPAPGVNRSPRGMAKLAACDALGGKVERDLSRLAGANGDHLGLREGLAIAFDF